MSHRSTSARPSPWFLPAQLATAAALCLGLYLISRSEIVWVISGVLAGAIVSLGYRRAGRLQAPNPKVRKTGQVLIGLSLGPAVAAQDMTGLVEHLPILIGAVVITLASSVALSRGYARVFRVDRLTAGLSTLPGGIGVMASVAAERGRPAPFVALVQGARVAAVVSIVPILITVAESGPSPILEPLLLSDGAMWLIYGALLLGAVLASGVATRLRVPVASLLGPLIFGIAVAVALPLISDGALSLELPYLHIIVAQVLLGITVGEYLAQPVTVTRSMLGGALLGVAGTLAVAFSLAVLLTWLTSWSLVTCILMMAPGGAPEMIALAAGTDAQIHLVVFSQLARQLTVNMLMPLWLYIFDQRASSG